MKTASLALALSLVAGAALAQPLGSHPLPAPISHPEGIAYDAKAGVIYTANATDGTIARTNLKSGASQIVAPAGLLIPQGSTTFPAVLGLKIDGAQRLWVAGGRTAKMFVVDARTGALLKTFATGDPGSLINDIAVTKDAAFFVDTLRPTLWRAPIKGSAIGELEPWLPYEGTPIVYDTGANLNGIAATPDGRTLIVGQMNKGLLFKIDVRTRAVTPIDIGGEALTGADGLVLDGRTLYVVRQPDAEIVTVALSADLSSGKVVSRFKDPALLWPATAAKAGNALLVVNSQFNNRGKAEAQSPFTVSSVPLGRLSGR